jgi:UPF0755 protein
MNEPWKTKGLMPRPRQNRTSFQKRRAFPIAELAVGFLLIISSLFSLPLILAADIHFEDEQPTTLGTTFPITVNPAQKKIYTDPRVEALLAKPPTQLPAAAGVFERGFEWLALKIASLPVYQQLAGAAGGPTLFVKVPAGARQEQVAESFGSALRWNKAARTQFVSKASAYEPTLPQGSTVPGIYFASVNDPQGVAALVHDRFEKEVRSRYSTTTAAQVPLEQALTVASLIEREAGGWDDMRLISGVIWNRLFGGMNLQIDATLQYAEANQNGGKTGWWPSVEPKDKYIKSAYNTYQHPGLPPSPIANPSIASVLAALNPKQTDCLFYFHDAHGQFHCTRTYQEHVALLKKYYGKGR